VVIFLRGVLTERITAIMWNRRPATSEEEAEAEESTANDVSVAGVAMATGEEM
jgi:hypothetical protein